ncbi:unnamed protein product [Ceutorhynchus assimilis]|uniref:Uncharacterized protein n=1 Tax=Ceutorhynchus assimilis TaxID=467358 RepID=A0A9N9MPR6_9CUCU|nr:unnamed protein product [Ceutorhynchus assimilis]
MAQNYKRKNTETGTKLKIATWNVGTLQDNPKNVCPEWETAIVARELKRCNIDIAGLSETRFADEGVDFAIRNSSVKELPSWRYY